jgi:hypothetical protein
MKGQIPVKYIIALILGIAVVALIGFWFFIVAGGFVGELTEAQCRARLLQFCNEKFGAGETTTTPGQWTDDWKAYEARCVYLDWSIDAPVCENVLRGVYPS